MSRHLFVQFWMHSCVKFAKIVITKYNIRREGYKTSKKKVIHFWQNFRTDRWRWERFTDYLKRSQRHLWLLISYELTESSCSLQIIFLRNVFLCLSSVWLLMARIQFKKLNQWSWSFLLSARWLCTNFFLSFSQKLSLYPEYHSQDSDNTWLVLFLPFFGLFWGMVALVERALGKV